MITSKDRQLLRHIDEYNFITIEQAHRMLYPQMKRGYEYARQRLQNLCEKEKRLKAIFDTATKTKIFIDIDSKIRNVSMHRIYTMNLYCYLLGAGCDIELFKLEKEWNDGKVRSDAFCIFTTTDGSNTYRFRLLVETNTSNNKINLGKYDDVTDEILRECNSKLPRIVLIDDRKHTQFDTDIYEVIRIDYNMSNLQNLFM